MALNKKVAGGVGAVLLAVGAITAVGSLSSDQETTADVPTLETSYRQFLDECSALTPTALRPQRDICRRARTTLNATGPIPTTTTAPVPPTSTLPPPTTVTPTTPTTGPPPPPSGAVGGPGVSGVPAGTVLSPRTGNVEINLAGTTITNLDIAGRVYVNASNVTIRNTHAAGGLQQGDGTLGLVVENSDFGPHTGRWDDEGIEIQHARLTRVSVHNFPDGIREYGDTIIESSWIHDLSIGPNDHNDGIQRYAPGHNGATSIFRNNRVDCVGCTTAGLFYADDWRGTLIIEGNVFNGGGYCLRVHESGVATVRNNRFKRSCQGKTHNLQYGNVTWTNNVWDDTGATINK